jgi:hypothetical protein
MSIIDKMKKMSQRPTRGYVYGYIYGYMCFTYVYGESDFVAYCNFTLTKHQLVTFLSILSRYILAYLYIYFIQFMFFIYKFIFVCNSAETVLNVSSQVEVYSGKATCISGTSGCGQ